MNQVSLVEQLNTLMEAKDTSPEQVESIWHSPIWFYGTFTEMPNGKVAIEFSAMNGDEGENPILFAYVSEAEAQKYKGHETLEATELSFGLISVMALQRNFDLCIVDADNEFILTREQIFLLRDLQALFSSSPQITPTKRNTTIKNTRTFIDVAYKYCVEQSDVRKLHIGVVEVDEKALHVYGVLDATNKDIHADALTSLYKPIAEPDIPLAFIDPLNNIGLNVYDTLIQHPPMYAKDTHRSGIWGKIKRALTKTPLILLQIDLSELPED